MLNLFRNGPLALWVVAWTPILLDAALKGNVIIKVASWIENLTEP